MNQHLKTSAKSGCGSTELPAAVRPQSAFSVGQKPLAKLSQARPKSAHAASLHRKGLDDPEMKLHLDALRKECWAARAEVEDKINTEKVMATIFYQSIYPA